MWIAFVKVDIFGPSQFEPGLYQLGLERLAQGGLAEQDLTVRSAALKGLGRLREEQCRAAPEAALVTVPEMSGPSAALKSLNTIDPSSSPSTTSQVSAVALIVLLRLRVMVPLMSAVPLPYSLS